MAIVRRCCYTSVSWCVDAKLGQWLTGDLLANRNLYDGIYPKCRTQHILHLASKSPREAAALKLCRVLHSSFTASFLH